MFFEGIPVCVCVYIYVQTISIYIYIHSGRPQNGYHAPYRHRGLFQKLRYDCRTLHIGNAFFKYYIIVYYRQL